MKTYEFVKRSTIAAPAADLFAWFTRPGAFERLAPGWEPVQTLSRSGTAPQPGSRTAFTVGIGPFRRRWIAEHTACDPGRMFRDEQMSGPFARWVHTHTVEPSGPDSCVLEDRVEYALPLGFLGSAFAAGYVRRKLDRAFQFRQRIAAQDVEAHRRWSRAPLRILVSGASGLIGSALVPYLSAGGHTVVRLERAGRSSAPSPGRSAPPAPSLPTQSITWDPSAGGLSPAALEGFDAVIHLAGENIAGGRWTAAKKSRIRESRVRGTKLLAESLARLGSGRPRVLVAASDIGYYCDRGDENLIESSPPGRGLLPEVCSAGEAAAAPARAAGIRTVNLRIGVVLSPAGGALGKMLLPFRLGAGGVIGDGRQWMSWIALDDLLDTILHAVTDASFSGPVNAVAPHPVTNNEWTNLLGRILSRPTLAPMPAFAARAAFGQMADELLLASTRVLPERLLATRHPFRFLEAEPALRHLLGR